MSDTFIAGQTGNISGQNLIDAINATQPGAIPRSPLTATATYNPPSLTSGTMDTIQTVTVTGAALGDRVGVSFSLDLQGVTLRAWVSAANTVSYVFHNQTAGTLDLASGTVKVWVI